VKRAKQQRDGRRCCGLLGAINIFHLAVPADEGNQVNWGGYIPNIYASFIRAYRLKMAALISSSANLSSISIRTIHADYQQLPCIGLDLAKVGDISRAAKSLGLDRKTLQPELDDYLAKAHLFGVNPTLLSPAAK
jgi:hypothetical protein